MKCEKISSVGDFVLKQGFHALSKEMATCGNYELNNALNTGMLGVEDGLEEGQGFALSMTKRRVCVKHG